MSSRILIALLGFMLALSSLASYQLHAQISENEAKQIFESIGCTSCHNGNVADEFDEIVDDMRAWSKKYPTIDDAVANEVTYFGGQKFNSFDELIAQMAQNVGKTPDDPDIKKLETFFRSLWGGTQQAGQEQQEQGEQAPTSEQPTQEQQQEQPSGVKGGQEPRAGVTLTIISIALIIVIAAASAVYLTRR